ncbi:MAG TPA: hypothetical protein DEG69_23355 [Flavobacteriaceae bacterium]|nr:hypothetical protein [Flavobacteriaceae bacterium]|tara:strand:- start:209 stop:484 length:276 start_codon:yes stop_codon:yes gene_type:complete
MNKYEMKTLIDDLMLINKNNSQTLEALTFQVRDFQNDLDVLKNQKNQYINRINWISKKYISLQKTIKANANGSMSQEDFDNMFPTSEEEIN